MAWIIHKKSPGLSEAGDLLRLLLTYSSSEDMQSKPNLLSAWLACWFRVSAPGKRLNLFTGIRAFCFQLRLLTNAPDCYLPIIAAVRRSVRETLSNETS